MDLEEAKKSKAPVENETTRVYDRPLSQADIDENQRKVVRDIIELVKERDTVPSTMFAQELSYRYKIEDVPMMDIEKTLWHTMTKDFNLGTSIQGWREEVRDGKKIRIPLLGLTADLEDLEDMIKKIMTNIRNSMNK